MSFDKEDSNSNSSNKIDFNIKQSNENLINNDENLILKSSGDVKSKAQNIADNDNNSINAPNNLTLKTLSISSINSSSSTSNSDLNNEQFDFSKTGAKPKIKQSNQQYIQQYHFSHQTSKQKSSKSSIASSSIKTDQMDIDDECLMYTNSINDVNEANKTQFNNNKSNRKLDQDTMEQLQMLSDFTEIIECPLCGKVVKNNLQKHFEMEHQEYECPYCGLLYDCETILNDHIASVHHCDEKLTSNDNTNFDIGVFDYKQIKDVESKNVVVKNDENKMSKNGDFNDEITNKSFVCPICNLHIQDQTWLELHVDSHFNSNNYQDQDDINNMNEATACSIPRSYSASSLTANVDENFELDQVMTLAECDLININENDKSNMSEKENPCSMPIDLMCVKDYQLAQMIERQEKEQLKYQKSLEQNISPFKKLDETNEQVVKDHITAQLLERQELEALKYNENMENNPKNNGKINRNNNKFFKQYDPNMTEEEELEWLKRKYGFNNMDRASKAEINLENALKWKKIDYKTYNEQKESLKNDLDSVFDSNITRSTGVIEMINGMNLSKWMEKRYLCSYCEHYGTGLIDGGYGCGYRNTQMLLSSIRADPRLKDALFNNNNLSMPSITKLQRLIQRAWQLGFDAIGKEQFNGTLENSTNWIGASDVAALFYSLKIRVELIDINEPKTNESISDILFNYVKNYFETSRGRIYPIYLQHQGHSRTIVGIEIGKNKTMNLIIFDPGTRQAQIEQFKQDPFKFMYLFRRSANTFKHKQYQLLVIRDLITTDAEYESCKILKSIRLS